MKMVKRILPLGKVYGLLETGPVVLLSTASKGVPNVMTMSWHTMLDFDPPLIGCVVSDRDYSFEALRKTKECVINIPTVELARQVVGCGNTSGKDLDKFRKFSLTPAKALLVKAPLIEECYANIECKVVDGRFVEKYGFFVLQGINAWICRSSRKMKTLHHMGHGTFMVAGRTIRLRSKMK